MDLDDLPEIVEAHLREALVAQDAGIVDEDVDPVPQPGDDCDHRPHAGLVGHQAGMASASPPSAAISAGDQLGRFLRQVVDDHPRTLRGKVERMGAAEPAARPGDDRNTSLKPHLITPPQGNLTCGIMPIRSLTCQ